MSQRASQVAEELRKIISMILIKDVNDPKLGFVTITRIEVTDDLRFARVFYSVFGDEVQQKASENALMEHKGRIRHLAVEQINMKFAMDMRFERDKSLDHSFHIDEILKKIKSEKPE